jgi:hypothetical protein
MIEIVCENFQPSGTAACQFGLQLYQELDVNVSGIQVSPKTDIPSNNIPSPVN